MESATQSRGRTLYEILGVDASASYDEIKYAWKRLSKIYHPQGGARPDEEIQKTLNGAADVLLDPERRLAYDNALREQGAKQSQPTSVSHSVRAESVDPEDHYRPEPLGPALLKLLGSLVSAAWHQIPRVADASPRIILTGALIVGGAALSSFVLRQCGGLLGEQDLERSLPTAIAQSCDGFSLGPGDLPTGADAGTQCSGAGQEVNYVKFDDYDDMYDFFNERRDELTVEKGLKHGAPGSCSSPGFRTRWSDGKNGSGSVLCFMTNGRPTFEWTDTADNIYSYFTARGRYPAAYQWWVNEAGPNGGKKNVFPKGG